MKLIKLLIFAVFIINLHGCGEVMDDTLPPVLPSPEPVPVVVNTEPVLTPGGTLRLSMRPPVTLNPLLNEDVTVARVLQLIYEPLITFDQNLRPVSHLASLDFTFAGDGAVVSIRDDAYWSDGLPVSAEDLVFSINTLRQAPPRAIYRSNIENFGSVHILNERSVHIDFVNIRGGAAYNFNFPVIPRHHFDGAANVNPPGNGPFVLRSKQAEAMYLRQNPRSFRTPNIEEVRVFFTNDRETDLHAFDRGLVDIYLSEVPDFARHRRANPVRFAEMPNMRYDFLGFNFLRSLPSNRDFRMAIAHSFDVNEIVPRVFLTHALPANSPIHPASFLHDNSIATIAYDTDEARRLAASFNMRADIHALTIIANEENTDGVALANILIRGIREIGIDISLEVLPFDEFYSRLRSGNFDMFMGRYYLSLRPDLSFAFHSESPDNLLRYRDFNMDRLLYLVNAAGNDSRLQTAISDLQAHFNEQLPVISLAFRHNAIVANRRIHGEMRPATDNIFINVEDWFVD